VLDEYEKYNIEKKAIMSEMIDNLIRLRQERNPDDQCEDLNRVLASYQENSNIPEALREVLFFNLLEQTISGKFYREMFTIFLKKCGYSTTRVELDKKEKKEDDFLEKIGTECEYENIASITWKEADDIGKKIKAKKATAIEKLQNEKHYFNKKISNDCVNKSEIFKKFYLISGCRQLFDNAYIESRKDIQTVVMRNASSSGYGFQLNSMTDPKLNYINTINEKLGIQNSFTPKQEISRERISGAIGYLNAEKQNIHTTFGFKDQSSSKEPLDFKRALDLLQKIYGNWTGMELKGINQNKSTKQFGEYEIKVKKKFGQHLNVFNGQSVHEAEREIFEAEREIRIQKAKENGKYYIPQGGPCFWLGDDGHWEDMDD
jgi:hypothetical protein